MSLDTQYLILDEQYKRIGMLDYEGATPYYNDAITVQIADADNTSTEPVAYDNWNVNNDPNANSKNWNHTGEITVAQGYPDSDKVVAGNHIAYYSKSLGHWYIMTIIQTTEDGSDTSGRHVTVAQLENIAITDMNNLIPMKQDETSVTVEDAFGYLLKNSGWIVKNQSKSALAIDLSFDGQNKAQTYLQQFLTGYNIELDAYVEVNGEGTITQKVFEIRDELGRDNGTPAYYGKNITGITRNTVFQDVITKLHVKGKDELTFASVNDGMDFIVDDDANQKYNPWYKTSYLEGFIESSDIEDPNSLKDWAKKMLRLYNHPRVNYTVDLTADFQAELGDTVRVIDLEMEPELTVESRVIQRTFSKADYTQNKIVLGEFVTITPVTPDYIKDIEDRIRKDITQLLEDVKNGKKQVTVVLKTPNGATWDKSTPTKQLIAQVFAEGTNLTSYFSQYAYTWTKTDLSGNHDIEWEESHKDAGNVINLSNGDVGTFTVQVNGDFLKEDAEATISFEHEVVHEFKNAKLPTDFWGKKVGIPQYIMWIPELQQYIISSAYDEDDPGTGQRSNADDVKFHLFDKEGNLKSSMVAQGAGHGSSFGYKLVNNVPEIWTYSEDNNGKHECVAKIPWQANKVVSQGKGITPLASLPKSENRIARRISLDTKNGDWVVGVTLGGLIEIVAVESVNAGKWEPTYKMHVQDFGFNPIGTGKESNTTMQSQGLNFPYLALNSGSSDLNEQASVKVINVVTQSLIDEQENSCTQFDIKWLKEKAFEPETVYLTDEDNKIYLYQSFLARTNEDNTNGSIWLYYPLYKTEVSVRDDSQDDITYTDTEDTPEIGEGEQ